MPEQPTDDQLASMAADAAAKGMRILQVMRQVPSNPEMGRVYLVAVPKSIKTPPPVHELLLSIPEVQRTLTPIETWEFGRRLTGSQTPWETWERLKQHPEKLSEPLKAWVAKFEEHFAPDLTVAEYRDLRKQISAKGPLAKFSEKFAFTLPHTLSKYKGRIIISPHDWVPPNVKLPPVPKLTREEVEALALVGSADLLEGMDPWYLKNAAKMALRLVKSGNYKPIERSAFAKGIAAVDNAMAHGNMWDKAKALFDVTWRLIPQAAREAEGTPVQRFLYGVAAELWEATNPVYLALGAAGGLVAGKITSAVAARLASKRLVKFMEATAGRAARRAIQGAGGAASELQPAAIRAIEGAVGRGAAGVGVEVPRTAEAAVKFVNELGLANATRKASNAVYGTIAAGLMATELPELVRRIKTGTVDAQYVGSLAGKGLIFTLPAVLPKVTGKYAELDAVNQAHEDALAIVWARYYARTKHGQQAVEDWVVKSDILASLRQRFPKFTEAQLDSAMTAGMYSAVGTMLSEDPRAMAAMIRRGLGRLQKAGVLNHEAFRGVNVEEALAVSMPEFERVMYREAMNLSRRMDEVLYGASASAAGGPEGAATEPPPAQGPEGPATEPPPAPGPEGPPTEPAPAPAPEAPPAGPRQPSAAAGPQPPPTGQTPTPPTVPPPEARPQPAEQQPAQSQARPVSQAEREAPPTEPPPPFTPTVAQIRAAQRYMQPNVPMSMVRDVRGRLNGNRNSPYYVKELDPSADEYDPRLVEGHHSYEPARANRVLLAKARKIATDIARQKAEEKEAVRRQQRPVLEVAQEPTQASPPAARRMTLEELQDKLTGERGSLYYVPELDWSSSKADARLDPFSELYDQQYDARFSEQKARELARRLGITIIDEDTRRPPEPPARAPEQPEPAPVQPEQPQERRVQEPAQPEPAPEQRAQEPAQPEPAPEQRVQEPVPPEQPQEQRAQEPVPQEQVPKPAARLAATESRKERVAKAGEAAHPAPERPATAASTKQEWKPRTLDELVDVLNNDPNSPYYMPELDPKRPEFDRALIPGHPKYDRAMAQTFLRKRALALAGKLGLKLREAAPASTQTEAEPAKPPSVEAPKVKRQAPAARPKRAKQELKPRTVDELASALNNDQNSQYYTPELDPKRPEFKPELVPGHPEYDEGKAAAFRRQRAREVARTLGLKLEGIEPESTQAEAEPAKPQEPVTPEATAPSKGRPSHAEVGAEREERWGPLPSEKPGVETKAPRRSRKKYETAPREELTREGATPAGAQSTQERTPETASEAEDWRSYEAQQRAPQVMLSSEQYETSIAPKVAQATVVAMAADEMLARAKEFSEAPSEYASQFVRIVESQRGAWVLFRSKAGEAPDPVSDSVEPVRIEPRSDKDVPGTVAFVAELGTAIPFADGYLVTPARVYLYATPEEIREGKDVTVITWDDVFSTRHSEAEPYQDLLTEPDAERRAWLINGFARRGRPEVLGMSMQGHQAHSKTAMTDLMRTLIEQAELPANTDAVSPVEYILDYYLVYGTVPVWAGERGELYAEIAPAWWQATHQSFRKMLSAVARQLIRQYALARYLLFSVIPHSFDVGVLGKETGQSARIGHVSNVFWAGRGTELEMDAWLASPLFGGLKSPELRKQAMELLVSMGVFGKYVTRPARGGNAITVYVRKEADIGILASDIFHYVRKIWQRHVRVASQSSYGKVPVRVGTSGHPTPGTYSAVQRRLAVFELARSIFRDARDLFERAIAAADELGVSTEKYKSNARFWNTEELFASYAVQAARHMSAEELEGLTRKSDVATAIPKGYMYRRGMPGKRVAPMRTPAGRLLENESTLVSQVAWAVSWIYSAIKEMPPAVHEKLGIVTRPSYKVQDLVNEYVWKHTHEYWSTVDRDVPGLPEPPKELVDKLKAAAARYYATIDLKTGEVIKRKAWLAAVKRLGPLQLEYAKYGRVYTEAGKPSLPYASVPRAELEQALADASLDVARLSAVPKPEGEVAEQVAGRRMRELNAAMARLAALRWHADAINYGDLTRDHWRLWARGDIARASDWTVSEFLDFGVDVPVPSDVLKRAKAEQAAGRLVPPATAFIARSRSILPYKEPTPPSFAELADFERKDIEEAGIHVRKLDVEAKIASLSPLAEPAQTLPRLAYMQEKLEQHGSSDYVLVIAAEGGIVDYVHKRRHAQIRAWAAKHGNGNVWLFPEDYDFPGATLLKADRLVPSSAADVVNLMPGLIAVVAAKDGDAGAAVIDALREHRGIKTVGAMLIFDTTGRSILLYDARSRMATADLKEHIAPHLMAILGKSAMGRLSGYRATVIEHLAKASKDVSDIYDAIVRVVRHHYAQLGDVDLEVRGKRVKDAAGEIEYIAEGYDSPVFKAVKHVLRMLSAARMSDALDPWSGRLADRTLTQTVREHMAQQDALARPGVGTDADIITQPVIDHELTAALEIGLRFVSAAEGAEGAADDLQELLYDPALRKSPAAWNRVAEVVDEAATKIASELGRGFRRAGSRLAGYTVNTEAVLERAAERLLKRGDPGADIQVQGTVRPAERVLAELLGSLGDDVRGDWRRRDNIERLLSTLFWCEHKPSTVRVAGDALLVSHAAMYVAQLLCARGTPTHLFASMRLNAAAMRRLAESLKPGAHGASIERIKASVRGATDKYIDAFQALARLFNSARIRSLDAMLAKGASFIDLDYITAWAGIRRGSGQEWQGTPVTILRDALAHETIHGMLNVLAYSEPVLYNQFMKIMADAAKSAFKGANVDPEEALASGYEHATSAEPWEAVDTLVSDVGAALDTWAKGKDEKARVFASAMKASLASFLALRSGGRFEDRRWRAARAAFELLTYMARLRVEQGRPLESTPLPGVVRAAAKGMSMPISRGEPPRTATGAGGGGHGQPPTPPPPPPLWEAGEPESPEPPQSDSIPNVRQVPIRSPSDVTAPGKLRTLFPPGLGLVSNLLGIPFGHISPVESEGVPQFYTERGVVDKIIRLLGERAGLAESDILAQQRKATLQFHAAAAHMYYEAEMSHRMLREILAKLEEVARERGGEGATLQVFNEFIDVIEMPLLTEDGSPNPYRWFRDRRLNAALDLHDRLTEHMLDSIQQLHPNMTHIPEVGYYMHMFPGMYQVRVDVRDPETGELSEQVVGSARTLEELRDIVRAILSTQGYENVRVSRTRSGQDPILRTTDPRYWRAVNTLAGHIERQVFEMTPHEQSLFASEGQAQSERASEAAVQVMRAARIAPFTSLFRLPTHLRHRAGHPGYSTMYNVVMQAMVNSTARWLFNKRIHNLLSPHIAAARHHGFDEAARYMETYLAMLAGEPFVDERVVGDMIHSNNWLLRKVAGDRGIAPVMAYKHYAAQFTTLTALLKIMYNVPTALANVLQPLTAIGTFASATELYDAYHAVLFKPSVRRALADIIVERGASPKIRGIDASGGTAQDERMWSLMDAASRLNTMVLAYIGMRRALNYAMPRSANLGRYEALRKYVPPMERLLRRIRVMRDIGEAWRLHMSTTFNEDVRSLHLLRHPADGAIGDAAAIVALRTYGMMAAAAREFVDSAVNSPRVMWSTTARLVFMFKTFMLRALNVLSNVVRAQPYERGHGRASMQWAKRLVKLLFAMFMTSGLTMLEMTGSRQLSEKAADTLSDKIGDALDLDDKTRERVHDALAYGLPSLAGVDLSANASYLDIFRYGGDTIQSQIGTFLSGPAVLAVPQLLRAVKDTYVAMRPPEISRSEFDDPLKYRMMYEQARVMNTARALNSWTRVTSMARLVRGWLVVTGHQPGILVGRKFVKLSPWGKALASMGLTPLEVTKAVREVGEKAARERELQKLPKNMRTTIRKLTPKAETEEDINAMAMRALKSLHGGTLRW